MLYSDLCKIMTLLTWDTGWPGWLGPLVVILALQGEGVQQKICVKSRTKSTFYFILCSLKSYQHAKKDLKHTLP